jgi:hypothetical protein
LILIIWEGWLPSRGRWTFLSVTFIIFSGNDKFAARTNENIDGWAKDFFLLCIYSFFSTHGNLYLVSSILIMNDKEGCCQLAAGKNYVAGRGGEG